MEKTKYLILISLGILIFGMSSSAISQLEINYYEKSNVSLTSDLSTAYVNTKPMAFDDTEKPLVDNIIQNGGFEEYFSNGFPTDWGTWGSSLTFSNMSYTDLTYGGSYSGNIKSKGTPGVFSSLYARPYFNDTPFLAESFSFDVWLNLKFPSVDIGGDIYIEARNYDPGIGNRYIRYYLSFDGTGSNSSTNLYIHLNQTTQDSWFNLNRNVTSDYEAYWGSPLSTTYLSTLYFYATSPNTATEFTELAIDDFTLTNGTGNHYQGGNGDFEQGDGSYWFNPGNTGPIQVNPSDDRTKGNSALNLTLSANGANSNGYGYNDYYIDWPRGVYPSDYPVQIEFDWKVKATQNGGDGQEAMFYLDGFNQTFNINLYFYMSNNLDEFSFTNDTVGSNQEVYYNLTGFDTKDAWHRASINLSQIMNDLNLTGITFYDPWFQMFLGEHANSSIQMLLDDFSLETYPLGDPGFEYDAYWTSNYALSSWDDYNNYGSMYTNLSTFARTGQNSARINVTSGVTTGPTRRTNLELRDNSIFSDFWWYLNNNTVQGSTNYAYFDLDMEDGKDLYYIVASSSNYSPTNSSSVGYFYVNDFNSSGTWNQINRNVEKDAIALWGSGSYNITDFRFLAYASGSGYLELFVDDINFFKDTHGPQISSILYNSNPDYGTNVPITFSLADRYGDVAGGQIFVSLNSGPFNAITTVETAPGEFEGLLLPQADTKDVEFYITATDESGNAYTDDNGGSYYTVTIDIPSPTVSEVFLIPEIPVHQDEVSVLIAVTDQNDIANSTLWYKTSSGGNWTSIVMSASGAAYQASIPASDWNTTVEYYVISENIYGETSSKGNQTHPLTYTVDDLINPTLTVIGPITQTIRGNVEFTVVGTDQESGVDEVVMSIDGSPIESSSDLPTVFPLNTTDYENGEHTVTFELSDNAGNIVGYDITYEINNPQGIDAIGDAANTFVSENGVIVGASAVVGSYVGVKVLGLYLRRREP